MANERNAGRKPVPNGVRVNVTVPKDRVAELKAFAKTLQQTKNKSK
jgi:hypothetical protein